MAAKKSDVTTFRGAFESVMRQHYPSLIGHIAIRLVSCPSICTEGLGILSRWGNFDFLYSDWLLCFLKNVLNFTFVKYIWNYCCYCKKFEESFIIRYCRFVLVWARIVLTFHLHVQTFLKLLTILFLLVLCLYWRHRLPITSMLFQGQSLQRTLPIKVNKIMSLENTMLMLLILLLF